MSFKVIMHTIQITHELTKFYKLNFSNSTRNNSNLDDSIIIYNSSSINNIEISLSLLIDIITYNGINKSKCFRRLPLLICELIKAGFKFSEFTSWNKLGFNCYIDKDVFYNQILEIPEEKVINKFKNKSGIFYDVSKKDEKYYWPITGDIGNNWELPEGLIKTKDTTVKMNKVNTREFIFNNLSEIWYWIKPVIYLTADLIFKDAPLISMSVHLIIDLVLYVYRCFRWGKKYSFSIQKGMKYEMKWRNKKLINYFLLEPVWSKVTLPVLQYILNMWSIPMSIQEVIYDIINYSSNLCFLI